MSHVERFSEASRELMRSAGDVVLDVEVMHLDDIGMTQIGHSLGFALKARQEVTSL